MKKPKKKIAVFVIAYQAVKTLISAIERIPKEFKNDVAEIYVFDDFSDDNTYYAGIGYKYLTNDKKLNIYRNEKNLGYGGNQKRGYNYAIKKGYDIVVMLHGDVQYAPEKIPELIAPLLNDDADMVFGSRIMGKPLKLRGGMPLWKYFGNRILTFIENLVLGTKLSEFHSGFRAYNVHALKKIPFNLLSNDYYFDTEIIAQFASAKLRIKEIEIPTHYGPESHKISIVKSIKYGLNILGVMIEYTFCKWGLIKVEKFNLDPTTNK